MKVYKIVNLLPNFLKKGPPLRALLLGAIVLIGMKYEL